MMNSAMPVNAGPGGSDHESSRGARNPRDGRRWERAPAVTIAAAFASGIAADRVWQPDWTAWAGSAVLSIIAVLVVPRSRVLWRAVGVVCLWVCLGGARHHVVWSLRPPDDVARFAAEVPRPAELIGRVCTPVEVLSADTDTFTPEWMRVDRSVCHLECESLASRTGEVRVSGLVRLEVSGHLLDVGVGDRVRVLADLARPRPPQNPGAFDFRVWLRNRGIDCTLRAGHPEAVTRVDAPLGWRDWVGRGRHRMRQECRRILAEHLQPRCVPVAASLLLGDRTGLTDEVETAFIDSGTMHLLAISGLHVSMLALLLYVVCRWLNVSPVSTAVFVLAGIGGYAFVTDHRPPVMRAAVLAAITVVALSSARRQTGLNTLAVSALAVLLWSPADLFDIGAQLSFLAVVGILLAARHLSTERDDEDTRASALQPERPRIVRWLRPALIRIREGYVFTAAIWLFTLPLTMSAFHLAAPVGFLVNVVLLPWSLLMLGAGFSLLVCGLLCPWLAPLAGVVFDATLSILLAIVEWSGTTPFGHIHLPGPGGWWLAGWYLLLSMLSGIIRLPVGHHWLWKALAVWIALGLGAGLRPAERGNLKCTFLSVGHGCAILIELPNGRTLLYDAGSLGSAERAQRTVQEALWAARRARIDVVIVSHADIDHFSGIAGLIETLPVGQVLFAQSFLDFKQSSVVSLCNRASQAGAPLRVVWEGDRLRADPHVDMDVLHPPAGRGHDLDNANSIVLRIRFAGRTILLTGDLEEAGLQRLLRQPSEPVDLLLAPHHGSLAANPPELAAWAAPRYVVASAGRGGAVEALRPVYGRYGRVLSTAESGAVAAVIQSDGRLIVTEFAARTP
jgi:competence protein ComEC